MNWAKKLVIALVIGAVFVGYLFYGKNQVRAEAKGQLLSLCGTDTRCQAAVNQHFDACFDENFRMGSRRRRASLDTAKLIECINQKSGYPWFQRRAQ